MSAPEGAASRKRADSQSVGESGDFAVTKRRSTVFRQEESLSADAARDKDVLERTFDMFDVDTVGFLTFEQSMQCLHHLGIQCSENDLFELLLEIDANESSTCDKASTDIGGAAQLHASEVCSIQSESTASPRSATGSTDFGNPFAAADAAAKNDLRTMRRKIKKRRVHFEDLQRVVFLWQVSARFQLFEQRSAEAENHVQSVTKTKFFPEDSFPMWVWQIVMLAVSTYLVMVAVAVFTNTDPEVAQFFALYSSLDGIVTVFLAMDIVAKLHCCVVKTNQFGLPELVDDQRGIIREYVGSVTFVEDMITLVPWRFTCFVGGSVNYLMRYDNTTRLLVDASTSGCVGCHTVDHYLTNVNVASFLVIVRAVKWVQHFHYFSETGLTPVTPAYVRRQFVIGHLLLQLVRFVVATHMLAVIYLAIDRLYRRDATEGNGAGAGRYAEALYLVLECLSTAGYGDVPPDTNTQRIYYMFLCTLGWLFNAYVVGSVIGFLRTSDADQSRYDNMVELATVLEYFEVPTALQLEVLSFENYLLTRSVEKSNFGHVVKDLPEDMLRNIHLMSRLTLVTSNYLFATFHRSVKLQICNLLEVTTLCPEEYVYLIGEIGIEMYFICHGFIDLLDENSHWVCTKVPGDSFGEQAVIQLTETRRSEDAKCLTYCEVFLLPKDGFEELRRQFPRVERAVSRYWERVNEKEAAKLECAMSVRFSSNGPCAAVVEGGGPAGAGGGVAETSLMTCGHAAAPPMVGFRPQFLHPPDMARSARSRTPVRISPTDSFAELVEDQPDQSACDRVQLDGVDGGSVVASRDGAPPASEPGRTPPGNHVVTVTEDNTASPCFATDATATDDAVPFAPDPVVSIEPPATSPRRKSTLIGADGQAVELAPDLAAQTPSIVGVDLVPPLRGSVPQLALTVSHRSSHDAVDNGSRAESSSRPGTPEDVRARRARRLSVAMSVPSSPLSPVLLVAAGVGVRATTPNMTALPLPPLAGAAADPFEMGGVRSAFRDTLAQNETTDVAALRAEIEQLPSSLKDELLAMVLLSSMSDMELALEALNGVASQ